MAKSDTRKVRVVSIALRPAPGRRVFSSIDPDDKLTIETPEGPVDARRTYSLIEADSLADARIVARRQSREAVASIHRRIGEEHGRQIGEEHGERAARRKVNHRLHVRDLVVLEAKQVRARYPHSPQESTRKLAERITKKLNAKFSEARKQDVGRGVAMIPLEVPLETVRSILKKRKIV